MRACVQNLVKAEPGEWVVIAIPYPTSLTSASFQVRRVENTSDVVVAAASLSAVSIATPFYFDSSTGLLWMLVRANSPTRVLNTGMGFPVLDTTVGLQVDVTGAAVCASGHCAYASSFNPLTVATPSFIAALPSATTNQQKCMSRPWDNDVRTDDVVVEEKILYANGAFMPGWAAALASNGPAQVTVVGGCKMFVCLFGCMLDVRRCMFISSHSFIVLNVCFVCTLLSNPPPLHC